MSLDARTAPDNLESIRLPLQRTTEAELETVAPSLVGPIMLVGSSGGHLAQLLALQPWWGTLNRSWVTFETVDASSQLEGEAVLWAHHPTTRNVVNLARNTLLAVRALRIARPELIVTTGAGVALPFVAVARAMGIRTIYIEVYDRIDSTTLTARLCRPFVDLFCVQWEEQRSLYPGSTVIGPLL